MFYLFPNNYVWNLGVNISMQMGAEIGEIARMADPVMEVSQKGDDEGTQAFMTELKDSGLLMDGEVTIQPQGVDKPFVYRGFQMVDETKLVDLRGDALRKMSQSGMLPLLYAHLFSLALMREIFERQVTQGKMPVPELTVN